MDGIGLPVKTYSRRLQSGPMQQASVYADHGRENIKLAAIEDDTSACEAMEEAARLWLKRRASKAKKT
jgi:hypothetical protein